ncbi:MAG: phospholipid carrier-dependent glycosyltransferase [Chloroflexi bacterium]|nr:phospholipid carrier-dependent glycosyltransferase [Chloroflexota bacterium]
MTQSTNRINQFSQRANWFLLLAIIAMGGFLRFYQIGSKGLWLDEAFSVWMGWQPVGEMLDWLVKIDQHPPLYYTLLHFWMAFGDSAATVRALCALFSTLTIPVIYLLGRRLFGDQTISLLAALILAVSPFHVRFAQEARMYALLALNASLATYALVRLLTDSRSVEMSLGQQFITLWKSRRDPRLLKAVHFSHRTLKPSLQTLKPPSRGRPMQRHDTCKQDFCPQDTPGMEAESIGKRDLDNPAHSSLLQAIETDLAWLGYIIFTAATLWTHNTAIFFPIATNIFILGYLLMNRSHSLCSLRNWLIAQVGVFLLWSPWLIPFTIQAASVHREFWIPEPTWLTVLGAIGAFLSDFLHEQICWPEVVWAGHIVLMALGLIRLRRRPVRLSLLLVLFLTPFVGECLVSLRRPIFYARTLIWASIPLYLLLAAGMRQLRHWPRILAVVVLALAVNGTSLRGYYVDFEKEQWDDAAQLVAERVEPDDLILFNATWVQIPFDFYFRSYNHTVAEHGVPVDLFDRGILEPKMTKSDLPRLRTLIQGHERVWLVYSHDWYTDPQRLIPAALGKELDMLNLWEFCGLQVQLYGVQ